MTDARGSGLLLHPMVLLTDEPPLSGSLVHCKGIKEGELPLKIPLVHEARVESQVSNLHLKPFRCATACCNRPCWRRHHCCLLLPLALTLL